MASNAPITGALTRAPKSPAAGSPIGQILSRFDRRELRAFVHVAIDLLDAIDAPLEDLEPEEDQSLEELYGEGEELLTTRPLYAVDQSAGPINEAAAHRAYMLQFVEVRA